MFLQLRDQHPELRLIVVPRHPERFESVLEELQRMGLNPLRRTDVSSPVSADSWKVLVVNTVGELRWWWGLADIAIVGGSFGSRGGQNMLEPAAYGANLAFGPNTSNFRDITEMLLREGGAERIESADEILPWIRKQLDDLPAGRKRGRIAQSLVRKHQGALARSVEELLQILESAQPKGQ